MGLVVFPRFSPTPEQGVQGGGRPPAGGSGDSPDSPYYSSPSPRVGEGPGVGLSLPSSIDYSTLTLILTQMGVLVETYLLL